MIVWWLPGKRNLAWPRKPKGTKRKFITSFILLMEGRNKRIKMFSSRRKESGRLG